MGTVCGFDDECGDIHGKEFSCLQNTIKNSKDLTLKKMFDISEKLVSEQEEINNLDNVHWKSHSWKQLSLIGDETVSNLQRTKVCVFSDSVLSFGKVHQHPESNETRTKKIEWSINEKRHRDFDGVNGEPTHFEWTIFPRVTTLQLCAKITDPLSKLGKTPESFTDISCGTKDNERECLKKYSGHFLVQVPKRSCILWKRAAHKEFGITSRTRYCWNSLSVAVQFSVQQLHCPAVSSRAKDTETCRITIVPIRQRLRLFA